MPLIKSTSKKAQGKNIATLREEGYPEKQAIAISYSEQERATGKASKAKKDKKN